MLLARHWFISDNITAMAVVGANAKLQNAQMTTDAVLNGLLLPEKHLKSVVGPLKGGNDLVEVRHSKDALHDVRLKLKHWLIS